MKKLIDFTVVENRRIHSDYALLILAPASAGIDAADALGGIRPGQFVQVSSAAVPGVMLRRPISINRVEVERGRLWLLVRNAGRATDHMMNLREGDTLNLLLPLGNGFTIPDDARSEVLLVGGGVGVAPLLQLGVELDRRGFKPQFLLGARSKADLLELDLFEAVGDVYCSTDDGSYGAPGFAAANPVLTQKHFDMIYCCGPTPMMKSIAAVARGIGASCEVSLENMMACGLGACLCCVEKTVKGNVCVCTEGPVFNIDQLSWQI